jgi:hypothetical protein
MTEISFSTIFALKKGCPSLISLEITDGLIGFDVDAFVALKDFTCLRRIKLLYDDNIVKALPRLLEESYSGYLSLDCSVISISFNIGILTLLLMPLASLHFCVGLDFVTPSLQSFSSKQHHHHSDSIEDVQFYENAGEIFTEEGGAARWQAMEESLVKISGVFPCVNIGLSDCWWI